MVYSKNPSYAATQKEDQKLVFKTDYRFMQVKSIAECSKLQFVIKIFVLSVIEWSLRTGFTILDDFSGMCNK